MEELQDSRIGRSFSIINRKARTYFSERLKALGIGPGQQAYLLSLQPGRILIQEDLARGLQVNKANVTRALQSLEKSGYVRRERASEDKRVWLVSLTDGGVAVRSEVEEIAKDWMESLKAPLSKKEWDNLESSLGKIVESLLDSRVVS